MFKRIPGTKDILPDEAQCWQGLEDVARKTFALFNYREIRPPLIEEESLFNRSLGQSSEVVQKQMFLIKNREDLYVLRPEATASIVRAYIENELDKTAGFSKLYYIGPMFRLERPQKGRLRQFSHIGCEAIGSSDSALDVELISLADTLLHNFSINGYKIRLNSLGCPDDKAKFSSKIAQYLKEKSGKLCEDCKVRLENNPLRILDCKLEACKDIVKGMGLKDSSLCAGCADHFSKVRTGIDALKIKYEVDPLLVRGLDYYTQTIFEISHPGLGAQDALGAGGRYNGLVRELGGPDIGAIGFAFGVERLMLVARVKGQGLSNYQLTYIITLGGKAKTEGLKLLSELRRNGIAAETDYESKSLKGAMRKANDIGAKFVLILGDDELKKGAVTLKNMETGEQQEASGTGLVEILKAKIQSLK